MSKNKFVLALLFLAFIPSVVFSQKDYRKKFTVGFKAGANISNVWDAQAEDYSAKPRLGFAGGINFTIPLGTYLALQPEIMYVQKGYRRTGGFLGTHYELNYRADYIDVPVLLAIRPIKYLSIVIGPEVSFHVYDKTTFTAGDLSSTQEEKFENDNLRKNRIGMHVGFDVNIGRFMISPRFSMDFIDNKGDGTSTHPRYKDLYFQLTFGVRL